MKVRVLLFAAARETVGSGALDIEVPDGATVASLLEHVVAGEPGLAPVLGACRIAVDEEFATGATPLTQGCTVAVLPPVSGG